MNAMRRATLWGALALATVSVGAAGAAPPAAAQPAEPGTYRGPSYSSELERPPTFPESQSKLWFHAGAWWALLVEPTGRTVRVFELMPDHSWRPTSAVVETDVGLVGDTFRDGDTVHVATRRRDETLQYVRLSFDAAARDYRADPGRLVTIRGSLAPPSIVEDSTGRLWIVYPTITAIMVSTSADGGGTWSVPSMLAPTGTGQTPEASDVVPFDDRIGVLWSDQSKGSFLFASHRDGDALDVWTRETAVAGPAEADDHISLMRVPGEPSDRLVAAVKTSQGDAGEPGALPLVEVLLRSPTGEWTRHQYGTVADGMNDPVVAVDESTQTVHVFASLNGNIIQKQAPVDRLEFERGPGRLFALGVSGETNDDRGLIDPTVTNEPVNAATGLVVLASDLIRSTYRHAELPLAATPVPDPADKVPPNPPSDLRGTALSSGRASLSWAPATDGDRWWPAADGVPVREYVISRDGAELATVPTAFFIDEDAPTPDDGGPSSATYGIVAVDVSGNRSPAVTLTVELAGETGSDVPATVGLALLVLAAGVGGVALYRRRAVPPVRPASSSQDGGADRAPDERAMSSAR